MEQITITEPRPPPSGRRHDPQGIRTDLSQGAVETCNGKVHDCQRHGGRPSLVPPDRCGNHVPRACTGHGQSSPGSTEEATPQPITPRVSDSDQPHVKVIPKGLRSFDEHDADFFLELVPGPRDQNGLPDNIRFWKTRIEETDPDKTSSVGLIYGPSGCGKSSLVKAGLLPRLAKHVLLVYIEATPEETEARLLKGLRKASPELSPSIRSGRFSEQPCEEVASSARSEGAAWSSISLSSGSMRSEVRRTANWSPLFGTATASMFKPWCWFETISGWRRPGS